VIVSLVVNSDERRRPSATLDGKLGSLDTFPLQFPPVAPVRLGVKVRDFGLARAVADTSATMTQTAAVIGTAQYLSPEQARGETVDARSDLYSTGCLLYELLAGRPPFVGDSPVSVAYQHVREAPVPPSQLGAEITPEIDAVVLKALAKNPDDRYQSAGEMKADIARLLSGQRPTAF
jgi:serine/threonine protein kinase